jgi:hypothetical protein
MKVTIEGRVIDVAEPQTVGASGFRKQTVVVQTDDKYDNEMPITLVKDSVGEMDASLGAQVKVRCYLGARQWNDRYFLELKYAGHELMQAPIIQAPAPAPTTPPGYIPQPDGLDKELPF